LPKSRPLKIIDLTGKKNIEEMISGDQFLFEKINQFALKWLWLDTLFIFFAQYFEYVLIFFLFLFLLKNFKKYLPMIFQAFLAAILARGIIAEIIRYFLPRSRPFVEKSVNLLINYPSTEPSFPSGHAVFYFAIATIVYLHNKKAGLGFFIGSFLITISRVFSGIHWPLDILAGAIIGIFSGYLIYRLFK